MLVYVRALLNKLSNQGSSFFPNQDIGICVAKNFLLRALGLIEADSVSVKEWRYLFLNYHKYRSDARGGYGYFTMRVIATYWVNGRVRSLYAELDMSCVNSDHQWTPNHQGSFVCIDGQKSYHVLCDHITGNIQLGVEGRGSHIPEKFLKEAAEVPWEELVRT